MRMLILFLLLSITSWGQIQKAAAVSFSTCFYVDGGDWTEWSTPVPCNLAVEFTKKQLTLGDQKFIIFDSKVDEDAKVIVLTCVESPFNISCTVWVILGDEKNALVLFYPFRSVGYEIILL